MYRTAALLTICCLATHSITSRAQSLQAAAPTSAPAGVCGDGSAAGQLTVSGSGTVSVTSDIATVSISVSATRSSAQAARETAAGSATAVLNAVRQIAGIQPTDVQSTSLTLSPQTTYNQNTSQYDTTGYEFTNGIQITVNGLTGDLLANVTDTAVQAGGDNVSIGSIDFDLSAGVQVQALTQARQQATQDAKSAAGLFAAQLEVTLDHVVSFSEPTPNISNPTPLATEARSDSLVASSAATTPTPVSVGKQTVTTSVTLTYAIC